MSSIPIAVAMLGNEELLDSDPTVQACLRCKISEAEATLAKQFLYPISSILQNGALLQVHDLSVLAY